MGKVRVAIVGVGNCACSLVQGREYYRDAEDGDRVPGLMHVRVGQYHVSDIEFACGFDVDASKVGKDLSEAVYCGRNNTIDFLKKKGRSVPFLDAPVYRGPTLDGLGKYYQQSVEESKADPVNVAEKLRRHGVDVLINYLPVGSEQATRFYMEEALKAGCGVVNCIPVFIAKDEAWQYRFKDNGLPIIGDDIKSQVGATIVHRVLAKLFNDRGVQLLRTSQLNVGGNMDFKNMLERERLESKRKSKTDSVRSQISHDMDRRDIYIGPSDYVEWLDDRKWAYIHLEGLEFGDVPIKIEFKLEVWDSPNSAGIVIDALRCCKMAMDRGLCGALIFPSAYFMKSPPLQFSDSVARDRVEDYIAGRSEGLVTTADFGNGRYLEENRELLKAPIAE